MPLPLSAFPEFQALQLLCEQAATRISCLEEQLPEWVDAVEACRLTNLSGDSLRRARAQPGSLIRYEHSRYKRASLLAHNDSRTFPMPVTFSTPKYSPILSKALMNELDLTQFAEFRELEQRCQWLMTRLTVVERKLPEWVHQREASRITGLSTETLQRWREKADSGLIWKYDHGVHYERASLHVFLHKRARGTGILARLLGDENSSQ